jgi:hypothetical membrane protein
MNRRVLLLCGVLSPVLYALADAVSGLLLAGYSFRDQTISELGALGAPSRPLFSALLFVVYLLFVAFGVGVWRCAAGRRALRVVGGLLIALGVLALAVGMFVPMRPRGTEQGLMGALHLIEGVIAMLLVFTAMGFGAVSFGTRFRIYTIATMVVMLVFGAWSGTAVQQIEAGAPTPWIGVIERIWWYAYQAWFAVLALTLLRLDAAAGQPK